MSSGGAREGAGRPKKPNKKVTVAVRVTPEVKAVIDKLSRRQRITQSKFIENALDNALKS